MVVEKQFGEGQAQLTGAVYRASSVPLPGRVTVNVCTAPSDAKPGSVNGTSVSVALMVTLSLLCYWSLSQLLRSSVCLWPAHRHQRWLKRRWYREEVVAYRNLAHYRFIVVATGQVNTNRMPRSIGG